MVTREQLQYANRRRDRKKRFIESIFIIPKSIGLICVSLMLYITLGLMYLVAALAPFAALAGLGWVIYVNYEPIERQEYIFKNEWDGGYRVDYVQDRGNVQVSGYERNGTWVDAHERGYPDGVQENNLNYGK